MILIASVNRYDVAACKQRVALDPGDCREAFAALKYSAFYHVHSSLPAHVFHLRLSEAHVCVAGMRPTNLFTVFVGGVVGTLALSAPSCQARVWPRSSYFSTGYRLYHGWSRSARPVKWRPYVLALRPLRPADTQQTGSTTILAPPSASLPLSSALPPLTHS